MKEGGGGGGGGGEGRKEIYLRHFSRGFVPRLVLNRTETLERRLRVSGSQLHKCIREPYMRLNFQTSLSQND